MNNEYSTILYGIELDRHETPHDCDYNAESLLLAVNPKNVKAWVAALPRFHRLKNLRVGLNVNEHLFQAICEVETPERLNIMCLRAKDLSSIQKLNKLTHLGLDVANQIDTLEDLSKLKKLKAFSIGRCKKIESLESLYCPALEYCGLNVIDFSKQTFKSLKPLLKMQTLREVSVLNVATVDKSISLLKSLPKLNCIHLGDMKLWSDLHELRHSGIRVSMFYRNEMRDDYLENILDTELQ